MRSILTLLALTFVLFVSQPVSAQICGDADGDGQVGVSDGVQALRAAAGLSSGCTVAICDLDGSGDVTVTDGVNVLRKAAGLAVDERCGGIDAQVLGVLREVQPLLTIVVGFATGTPVTSCANDGDVSAESDAEFGVTTTFDFCQVGNIELDGDITIVDSTLSLTALEVSTVGDEDFISQYDDSFDGEVAIGTAGQGTSLNGPVDVTSEVADEYSLTFNGAIVTAGVLTGGGATIDLAGSDLEQSLRTITLTFDGSGIAAVVVTPVAGDVQNIRFDLNQSTIVP